MYALNGSGRAPAAADIDWYESRQMPALENTSAHSVTVPGAVNAWETLLKAHGRKGLDELLQPAIRYAAGRLAGAFEGGLGLGAQRREAAQGRIDAVSCRAVRHRKRATSSRNQRWRKPCGRSRGMAPRRSTRGRCRRHRRRRLRERGGLHTEEDFARGLHNAEFVEPITLNWKGYDVYQCPPNGQGLLVLMILGMLGGLPSAPDGASGVIRAHRHIEAARLAYRDRDAFLADPGAVDVPVKNF